MEQRLCPLGNSFVRVEPKDDQQGPGRQLSTDGTFQRRHSFGGYVPYYLRADWIACDHDVSPRTARDNALDQAKDVFGGLDDVASATPDVTDSADCFSSSDLPDTDDEALVKVGVRMSPPHPAKVFTQEFALVADTAVEKEEQPQTMCVLESSDASSAVATGAKGSASSPSPLGSPSPWCSPPLSGGQFWPDTDDEGFDGPIPVANLLATPPVACNRRELDYGSPHGIAAAGTCQAATTQWPLQNTVVGHVGVSTGKAPHGGVLLASTPPATGPVSSGASWQNAIVDGSGAMRNLFHAPAWPVSFMEEGPHGKGLDDEDDLINSQAFPAGVEVKTFPLLGTYQSTVVHSTRTSDAGEYRVLSTTVGPMKGHATPQGPVLRLDQMVSPPATSCALRGSASPPLSAAEDADAHAMVKAPDTTGTAFSDSARSRISHKTEPNHEIRTTVMIRNLPSRLKQRHLIMELDQAGFAGTYDFCYLPCTFTTGECHGFAFVNFVTPADAKTFMDAWRGSRQFGGEPSDPSLNISFAVVQGREANLAKWTSSRQRRVRNPNLRPFVVDFEDKSDSSREACRSSAAIPAHQ